MKIYKYSPFNELSLENLKNYGLWFSSKFEDDPYDNNLPIGDFRHPEFLESSIEFFNQNPKLYEKYAKIFEASQISRDPDKAFNMEEMLNTMKKTYHGITCFSNSDTNEYMWKKFANNHSGFCLCFETKLDLDFFKELYPVNYENELPVIDFMNNDLPKQMEIYTLTKRNKYIPENEIRLLKHKQGLHKYKSESLIGITIGKNFSNDKSLINLITKYYNHKILIQKIKK